MLNDVRNSNIDDRQLFNIWILRRGKIMMQLTINKEIFKITETDKGYNIKSINSDRYDKSVNHGELNASIYRLMEILGI